MLRLLLLLSFMVYMMIPGMFVFYCNSPGSGVCQVMASMVHAVMQSCRRSQCVAVAVAALHLQYACSTLLHAQRCIHTAAQRIADMHIRMHNL